MAAYCWLRDRGIQTVFQPATSASAMIAADLTYEPDLILAPTLTNRVPRELLGRVVINHPGRMGDRGASAIDWGRYRREPFGGNTLLLAAEGWDMGDVLHTATHPYPDGPATKSWIYAYLNRAAMLRGLERLTAGPTPFARPLNYNHADVLGTWNDVMRQTDCTVDWSLSAEEIVWRAAARDGAPGVLAELMGRPLYIYDVQLAGPTRADQGQVVSWITDGAIRVAVGRRNEDGRRGSVWIGCVKPPSTEQDRPTFKQPAAWWLRAAIGYLPPPWTDLDLYIAYRPVTTEQRGSVAIITASAYNGAWSTRFCRSVAITIAAAARRRDIDQIVLRGGGAGPFGNGIHLNHIYGASHRSQGGGTIGLQREAEANIRAINDVGLEVFRARRNGVSVITLLDGDAGAGGAFLSLCSDVVVAVPGRIFNYHYKGMGGLTGSEFHTLTLPFRMMDEEARTRLLHDCLPVSAYQAHRQGLVDYLVPEGIHGRELTDWILEFAAKYRCLVQQEDLQHWRPLPSEADLATTQERELRTIDRDFATPDFQAALTGFVLKRRGPPPRAATEYRGSYDGTLEPDSV